MRTTSPVLLLNSLLLTLSLCFSVYAHELPEFTQLVEQNRSSIVNISTKQKVARRHSQLPPGVEIPENSPWGEFFRRFGEEGEGQEYDATSLGSGFVLSSDGYLLTNHHVVKDADEILVRFHDRKEYQAKVIGSDPRSDIALLKIEARGLKAVKFGDSDKIKVGEWVMAIGSPFGFEQSVSVGVVSAINRNLPNETYVPFIQTDVAINPGNSGGPLFNTRGEVIGINAQIYSQTGGFMGLSFAIPMTMANDVVAQLKKHGRVTRGWLGVYIQNVDKVLAESFGLKSPKGALVSKVFPKSPASKAGLRPGDVIIEFNGHEISYSSDLPPLVGRTVIDSRAKLIAMRNGERITKYVTIEALPEEGGGKKAEKPDNRRNTTLGLEVEKIPSQLREQLKLGKGGILVRKVLSGPAKVAGISSGDILLRINGKTINGPRHFRKLVKALPKGKAVSAYVLKRNSQAPLYLAIKIPK